MSKDVENNKSCAGELMNSTTPIANKLPDLR